MNKRKINLLTRIIAFIICMLILFVYYLKIKPWMLDDAFISFRYAENFSKGFGLVFNPGETPVEGYTNFLWIILLSAMNIIGLDIVLTSQVLGYFFSLATITLLLFYPWTKKLHLQIIAALILVTSGTFSVWGASGMETSLFTFLVTMSVLKFKNIIESKTSSNNRYLSLGIVLGLATLTRPEGYIAFFILTLGILYYLIKYKRISAIKHIVCYLAPFLTIVASHIIFRIVYYNDLLPNTFYNKVSSGMQQYLRGLRYTKNFILANSILIFFSCILLLFDKMRAKQKLYTFSIIYLVTVFVLYIIYVGGDVMPAYRFFCPLMAILSILASLGLDKFLRFICHKSKFVRCYVYSTILVVTGIIIFNIWQSAFDYELKTRIEKDDVALKGKESGKWLKANFSPDTIIATNTAGSIPYYSELRTIDMLGLNDKHIAKREMPDMGKGVPGHEKSDGKYILFKKPDIIILGSSLGSEKPHFISGEELFALEEFKIQYRIKKVTLPSEEEFLYYERIE